MASAAVSILGSRSEGSITVIFRDRLLTEQTGETHSCALVTESLKNPPRIGM